MGLYYLVNGTMWGYTYYGRLIGSPMWSDQLYLNGACTTNILLKGYCKQRVVSTCWVCWGRLWSTWRSSVRTGTHAGSCCRSAPSETLPWWTGRRTNTHCFVRRGTNRDYSQTHRHLRLAGNTPRRRHLASQSKQEAQLLQKGRAMLRVCL